MPQQTIPAEDLRDARIVWDVHRLRHPRTASDAAVVLGCPDRDVPAFAAELYHEGLFPVLVFTGATSGSTVDLFPEGEAVAFRAVAAAAGVPERAMLIEPRATNTGENIQLSRRVLADAGIVPASVTLVTMPYMERRAFATCRRQWPEVRVSCASRPIEFADYLAGFEDRRRVIGYMVGDLQRVIAYPELGFAIEQDVPEEVQVALKRLIAAGYDGYLIKT